MTTSATLRMRLGGGRELAFGGRALVMGILNVTPDSFSDGGNYSTPQAAADAALRMVEGGADLIDVGGESTRPGAEGVSEREELRRVLPALEKLRAASAVPVSVDTSKAAVAEAALAAGADIINDVTALRGEPRLAEVAAASGAPVVLMHMQGEPRDMQKNPVYVDVAREVRKFLLERAEAAVRAGVKRERIILDPGFGFGKTFAHNAELLRRLEELTSLDYPVLVGMSRKSMIGHALGLEVSDRLLPGAALAVLAAERGAAVIRTHDVQETVRAVRMAEAVMRGAGAWAC